MKPILLLDGDLILYRNAIACEREVKFDEENWVLWSNEERAWSSIQSTIEGLKSHLKSDRAILCFSEGRSFRYNLYEGYKSNRQGQRKPLGYTALVVRAIETYETKGFDGLEADDVMGILSTKPGKSPKIIVSDDKDMKTIPGLLYRQGELIEVTEADADYWHMYQTLIGDSADGYAGLPGCGPKTAEKILSSKNDDGSIHIPGIAYNWQAVCMSFEAKGLTEDDALLQARLARILRTSDFDPITKKVKLWTPPL